MEQFLTKAKHTELSRLSVSPSGHTGCRGTAPETTLALKVNAGPKPQRSEGREAKKKQGKL